MGLGWYIAGLVIGLALLAWSADVFVDGSAALARRLGVPALLVGMIVIGFGTSLPEMLVSVISAIEGSPSMALGNAYGSDTANIGLIIGICAIIAPLAVAKSTSRREMPILMFATVASGFLIIDGSISRKDALAMLALFVVSMAVNIRGSRAEKSDDSITHESPSEMSDGRMAMMTVGGLAVLGVSSRMLVVSAIGLAKALGVPDLIVGLTVVAIGTSLPELASAIAAVRKREHDLAVGNIIGSNLFNTLCVVGLACAIAPMEDAGAATTIRAIVRRDYPFVCAATVLMALACMPWRRGRQAKMGRAFGMFLVAFYVAYIAILIYRTLRG